MIICLGIAHGCFGVRMAVLSSGEQQLKKQSLKYLLSAPLQKKLASLCWRRNKPSQTSEES